MPITINGTGSISGISAGGLPDASVTPADLSQPLTQGIAQTTTSGTAIDFTGIPSWVKRVTVMFNGVSLSGSSSVLVQLGAGSIVTTGYTSQAVQCTSAPNIATLVSTSGFVLMGAGAAAALYSGVCQITNLSGNAWTDSGTLLSGSAGNASFFGGSVTLSGTLDRIRITTVNGTDTFDAGSINILYE